MIAAGVNTPAVFFSTYRNAQVALSPKSERQADLDDRSGARTFTVAIRLQVFAFIAQSFRAPLPNPEALRHLTFRD